MSSTIEPTVSATGARAFDRSCGNALQRRQENLKSASRWFRILQMAPAKRPRTSLSDAHKAALAEGREQGRAIRRYLDAREAYKPKRGRKRTPESIKRQLATIEKRLQDADALTALQLRQLRMDLERELSASTRKIDMKALEAAFVSAAGPYSRRKGISYAAWREAGIPPDVLKRAGIKRGNG